MTNGDRIRQMSDEELALSIMCPNEMIAMGAAEIACDPSKDSNCCKCCCEWLKEEEPAGGNRTGSGNKKKIFIP